MTSPNAQINIKQRDLLPSISLPDDVSVYAFFRRSIQGWRWHPIRCLSPLHSGPGAPGSRTRSRGHRPSAVHCTALSRQHHCCWMRNMATDRLLWPEPQTSGDPRGSCAKTILVIAPHSVSESVWKPAERNAPDRVRCASLPTAEQRRVRRSKTIGWLVNNRRMARTERSCSNL